MNRPDPQGPSAPPLHERTGATGSGALIAIALALTIVAYIGLATRHLLLPGLYYDEALRTGDALAILEGRPALATADWRVPLAGRRWPMMSNTYTGSVKSYLWMIAFAIGGVNVQTLRLTAILVAAVGLLWVALLAREIIGGWSSVVAMTLLATDPSFILYTRTDWGPIAVGFALRAAFLFFLWRWWSGLGRRPLLIAALLAGIGMWDKANFVWIIVAVLAVGLLVWLASRDRRPLPSRADLAATLGAFFLGSAPFWVYNVSRRWATVRSIARPGDPADLTGLMEQFSQRTAALRAMFGGYATTRWMFGDRLHPHFGFESTLLLPLTAVACVVIVIVGLATRRTWFWAVPLMLGVILAQIYATPRAVWVHHWITIYPLPQLAIGMALSSLALFRGRLGIVRIAVSSVSAAIVAFAILLNVLIMRDHYQMMERTGGREIWSDAIYRLNDALQQRYADRPFQVMDWGISNQLTLLSRGALTMRGLFWFYMNSTEPQKLVISRMRDPASVFLLFAPEAEHGSRAREALDLAARTSCRRVRHAEQFLDRRATPVFLLLEYEPGPCVGDTIAR